MKIPTVIYFRALGIYAVITIPALIFPPMYFISLALAVAFGTFAWLIFAGIYFFSRMYIHEYAGFMGLLSITIPGSVLVSFQMIEVFGAWNNIWDSGGLLIYPLLAIVSGWVSLGISSRRIGEKMFAKLVVEEHDHIEG